MPTYMFVLRDIPQDYARITPEEMQRIIQKYRAWAGKLREQGVIVSSDKLVDGSGKVMRRGKSPLRVTDGPFAEGKEIFGGYFAVKADSYEEAVKIAEGCPHLDMNGTLEIREVEVMRGAACHPPA